MIEKSFLGIGYASKIFTFTNGWAFNLFGNMEHVAYFLSYDGTWRIIGTGSLRSTTIKEKGKNKKTQIFLQDRNRNKYPLSKTGFLEEGDNSFDFKESKFVFANKFTGSAEANKFLYNLYGKYTFLIGNTETKQVTPFLLEEKVRHIVPSYNDDIVLVIHQDSYTILDM